MVDGGRRALLPRDEHPAAGRAPGDRGGHRARPGPPAAAGGRRGAPAGRGPRGRGRRTASATPSRPASTPRTRPPAGCPPTGTLHRFEVPDRRGRSPSGSTAASSRARWSAPTTTRCWPRSSPTPPPGPRPPPRWPPRWPAPGSTGSPPTATCWCGSSRHPGFLAGETDTGFLDRHGLDRLAAPLADDRGRAPPRLAAALAGQAAPPGRAAGAADRALGLPQQPVGPAAGHLSTSAGDRGRSGYRFDRHGRPARQVAGRRRPALDVDDVPVTGRSGDASPSDGVTRHYRVEQVGADRLRGRCPTAAPPCTSTPGFPLAADQVARGLGAGPHARRRGPGGGGRRRPGGRRARCWWCSRR